MDTVSPAERSRIMASVKSSGNRSTEMALIAVFRRHKLSGWRRRFPLQGNPDFVFPNRRLALFVDGCLWHGCSRHCRLPANNRPYWVKKIQRNKKRDAKNNRLLRGMGWSVIRIWEHELAGGIIDRKIRQIQKRRPTRGCCLS